VCHGCLISARQQHNRGLQAFYKDLNVKKKRRAITFNWLLHCSEFPAELLLCFNDQYKLMVSVQMQLVAGSWFQESVISTGIFVEFICEIFLKPLSLAAMEYSGILP
jgi:hypothetical protein